MMAIAALLGALERRRRRLLWVGGGLVLVYAGLFAVEAVSLVAAPTSAASGVAYLVVFAGVLGLHPDLVEASPYAGRLGGVCVALGAIGFLGVFVVNAGQLAGVVPSPGPDWLALVNLPAIVGMIPGFLLVGIASLRTDAHPRALGLLLLAPAAVFAVNVAVIGTGGSDAVTAWLGFVLTLGEGLAVLGVAALVADGDPTTPGGARQADAPTT